ncbi:MAG TPA: hypothetical protein VMF57_06625 [Solirubrobacteraceae bacterium]|nr:hypothetical protein [Solirubrobacteraceae bacterium]
MTAAGTGTESARGRSHPSPSTSGAAPPAGRFPHPLGWSRWAAVPFALVYLILLAHHLESIARSANLDADIASGPVISELFGAAPAHANVVLGEFAWYATLLFDLATKWLPAHRQVWEYAPYAMALAAAGLAAWGVSQVADRWAAALTAVLLICASPATLHLELSTTQHAPVWFCLALVGAFVVLLERRGSALSWPVLIALILAVGTVTGVNAASDPLVSVAVLAPFVLALVVARVLEPGQLTTRAFWSGLATLAVTGLTWGITAVVMSALAVTREPGLHTTRVTVGHKTAANFKLWWKSIAVLGNGDYFGRPLSPGSALAFVCAVLSIAAVVSLPWLCWRQLRRRGRAARSPVAGEDPAGSTRVAFYVFWCASAVLLTLAFLFSSAPADIGADRYLVGLLYPAAAAIPAAVAGARPRLAAPVLAGVCIFALGGVVSMAQGGTSLPMRSNPPVTTGVANRIAAIAAREHLTVGYAGYWAAAPVTWATGFRVQVYPVAVCDQQKHLCRFDLHFISSWYSPRAGTGSFLLVDPNTADVWTRTPDLGRPRAVYRIGRVTMYVYSYDLASRIRTVA